MSGLISTAAREYANRPKDEIYPDLAAMIGAAQHERDHSKEVEYNLKDLHVLSTDQDEVRIESPKGAAKFTHWAFDQFCRVVKAPAGYLRTLPASIAADALNHGIQESPIGARAELLVRAPNGCPEPTIRSITSERYGRLWDCELYSAADRMVFGSNSVSGQPWIAPPTWSGDTAGTWRGDRDSFVIRVDGGSIVTDPSVPNGQGQMYRGILLRNSEVGGGSVVIDWVLFEYICGNLNLWGAVVDRRFRRRHVGKAVLRDTIRELGTLARQWTQRSASQDEQIIRTLIDHQLAGTKDATIDELRKIGYSKEQAEDAIDTCEKSFSASPFSFWGLAQGTTKNSQRAEYQNDRYELDQLAARVLTRGARLVTA